MASKRKTWMPSSPRQKKSQVPDSIKRILSEKADEIIENDLKPKHIRPPPTDNNFNYLVDIYSKWYRNYFYFCAKYNCPSPNAISPSFETKFASGSFCGWIVTLYPHNETGSPTFCSFSNSTIHTIRSDYTFICSG